MSQPRRIAMFVGTFPVVSETFIVRQIGGLLDAGCEVDIYADCRSSDTTVQPEVKARRLLERVTWMDMPPETTPWEMPVWPLTGHTWAPGSGKPVHNSIRFARALPALASCALRHPRLLQMVMDASEYGYQAQSLSSVYRLHQLSLVDRKYDVLHAHFGPVAKSFRFARQLWKAPLVVSFHGYDFSTVPRKEGERVYKDLFPVADVVTVNSAYTARQVEKLGCPAEKIRKLSVGLRMDDFPCSGHQPKAGAPVRIITVGRLVEIKGHEYVIRALAELVRRGLDFRYDVVGDGPLRAKLEKLASDAGLDEYVIFHGPRTSAEVQRLLGEADLFVLASVTVEGDREGQGLAVQEAQAIGLPVVVTQHGALPEGMRHGETGFVVPERDIEALCERLHFLASHREVGVRMGLAGRKFVEENYDIQHLTRQLIGIYEEAVQRFER